MIGVEVHSKCGLAYSVGSSYGYIVSAVLSYYKDDGYYVQTLHVIVASD